jgi:hypothetical protein
MIIKTREFSEFPSIADHLIYYPGQSQNCRLISVENVLSKFPTSENRRVEFLTEFFVEFCEFSVDFFFESESELPNHAIAVFQYFTQQKF